VNDLASRWCGSGLRGLMFLVAATGWSRAAAQVAFNPSAQLWPSSADAARPSVGVFGSAVACTFVACDPVPSFGLDVGLVGPLRAAVAGPRSSPQVGLSYAWRRIDIATRIGQGATIVRPFKGGPTNMIQHIRNYGDTLGGLHAETTYVSDATNATDAIRWSSAEARLTWREDRWWATALVGRMAVAQQGSGLWGGLQLGAELGRGASLLIGASSSPRLLASAQPNAGRNTVSLGFGFNAGVFSRRAGVASGSTNTAFVISPAGAGRVRVAIRVASADSVEFASDCTQWRPVQMTRDGDRWVVDVAALAGLHRANIRVNGGRWMSPPGLASMDDDFAGEVGIFVVQ
jgi:hypothetical protein